ncbi:hypothetical protein KCTC52924_03598 [Arenibacter antarcticus]|uniref:Uncharacterized protein n=1 Tax=Arenibacter antarcticus TaxID=2040469 RepID=A0ABW5VF25_9FLAO|nr:hypothetical protein [Arenibacter sp. H213]MCM4169818.1 hypothetical protein [Arenibacter sp. H213]
MKEEKYIIGIAVGYVLKIMKAHKTEAKFRKEFASIRHGNYPKFINLVNGDIPEMGLYRQGEVEVNPKPKTENIDFVGLFMAGPSMKVFYEKCVTEYGDFGDNEISNELYYQIGLFEITVRIHANNHNKIEENHAFEDIIFNLGQNLKFTVDEINTLQKGRKLLNVIKHGMKKNYSWSEGINDFKKAQILMDEKQIVLEY